MSVLSCPVLRAAASSLAKPGYFLGFYFWLDAIATASLFFEVPSVKVSFAGSCRVPRCRH